MAKKSSEVGTSKINALLEVTNKPNKTVSYPVADGAIDIEIKTFISLEDECRLIRDISDALYISQVDDAGEPVGTIHLEQYAVSANIISYFTNIKALIPAETMWKLIINTDIVDQIVTIIGTRHFDWIVSNAKELALYNRRTPLDEAAISVRDILNTLETKLQNMPAMSEGDVADVKKLTEKLANVDNKTILGTILAVNGDEN